MKKTLTIVLAVFLLIAAVGVTAFALNQDNDGWYEIATAEDLLAFKEQAATTAGLKAKLVADIDMKDVKDWTPFGEVKMFFDGQGHTISNLTYTTSRSGNIGLFVDRLSNAPRSHVYDVTFEDCTLNVTATGAANVGLVGACNRASVTGVALENVDITVNQTATGELWVAGIVGRSDWQFSSDNVYSYVGGSLDQDCSIAVTAAAGNTSVGVAGILGTSYNTIGVIQNSVVNATITGPNAYAYQAKFFGATKAEICNCTNNTTLADVAAPTQTKYHTYVDTAADYITFVKGLNDKKADFAGVICIGADLDFKGLAYEPIAVPVAGGTIDGQGHTFSNINLTYDNVTTAPTYGFGIIANRTQGSASVLSLKIKDSSITVNVTGKDVDVKYVAGVVAQTDRTRFVDIALENVDVTLTGSYKAGCSVGGIVGYSGYGYGTTMMYYNCTLDKDSSVSATDAGAYVGGIAGRIHANSTTEYFEIRDCVNYAAITSPDTAGGLLGRGQDPKGPNKITNSANYGTIIAGNKAGSLVGDMLSWTVTIDKSVAGGFVIAPTAGTYVGSGSNVAAPTNSREVAIVNPLTADGENNLAGYAQTADAGEGKKDLRVVFLAKENYVLDVQALTINLTFYDENGEAVKEFNDTLGKEVYKSVTAAGDVYFAPDGIVMFGNIITGIPTDEAESVIVTVTDADGAEVFASDYFYLVD